MYSNMFKYINNDNNNNNNNNNNDQLNFSRVALYSIKY